MVMNKACRILVLVGLAGTVALGCRDDGNPDQGREEQEEACGLGYAACINNCNKRTLGASCVTCCGRKNVACKLTGDYEFEACFK